MNKWFLNICVIISFVVVACSVLYIPTSFASWLFHSSNRADLSQIDKRIAINQEEYDRIIGQLANIGESSTAFRMNKDTPVASLVKAQLEIAKTLVFKKEGKTRYIGKIISRCNGPWAPVVWVFDPVTCDEYRKM